MSRLFFGIAMLCLLSSCAFPHWNRYAVVTQVLDEETNEPIAGAHVVVEVFHQRSPVPSHYYFYRTDDEGNLEISESKDWQVTPPLPDAMSIDFQYLTVYKSGYAPYQLKGTTSEPIRLRPVEAKEMIGMGEAVHGDGDLQGADQLNFGGVLSLPESFRPNGIQRPRAIFSRQPIRRFTTGRTFRCTRCGRSAAMKGSQRGPLFSRPRTSWCWRERRDIL